MIKRICSILTLIVLVLTECFMPMNYALAEDNAEPDFQIEENMNQDTYEEISDDDIESDIEDTVIETGNEELGEGENAGDVAAQTDDEETKVGQETEDIQPEPENNEELGEGENAGDVAAQTDDEETKAGQETEDIQPEPENNEELGEGENAGDIAAQTDGEETKAGQETEDIQPEPENNEDNDGESTSLIESLLEDLADIVKYFFKKEGDIRYIKYGRDADNIGTITLKDPKNGVSITIMDKNLGAESVGVSRNSYGYYFQWGNNHGVKTVDSSNKTTQKAVYKDSYYNHGYDGEGKFIVGGTDYWEEGAHYNSLWGNESKESSRYGACPVGYHIPTMKEWNQLLDIWGKIHTQDTSKSEMVLRYSANYSAKNIHTFKGAATQCGQGDTECVDEDKLSVIIDTLSSELKLPLAGSYDENGNFHDGLGVYWTSISKDGNKAGVFDMNAYIGNGTDDTLMYKSQGHNIRCFQNLEPYVSPVEIEEQINPQEVQEEIKENQDDKETQEGNTENQEGEVEQEIQQEQIQKDIPAEFISYSLVLDTTKDFMNVELNANGGKFSDEEESKTVKYGYYNQEATIDVNALKQDEYRSGYEIKELPVSPVGYKLMDEVEIPTRDGYIFDGWYARKDGGEKLDMNDSFVLENMEVYAHWVAKEYTITWKNEDGTIRDTTKVAYGQMPMHVNLVQPADEKYTYTFAGWEPEIKEVVGDAEYRAKYTYTLRKYTVTWKNEDETVLKTEEVEYGTIPTYDGEVPTKESTEEFEYIFTGWDKEISEVKGNVEYVARYDAKEIENEDVEDLPILSQDDENNTSGTLGGGSESYVGEGGTEQDSSDILEGQENSQEDENSEESQGFFGGLWEILKSFFLDDEDGYLRGSETIDDIVVSVEAEKGTFPEGTEVVIKGVPQDRLEIIQTSLIEDENNSVTEEAQILAFDISFVYSGEEIQPEKEVSVKFNYKDNSDFQGSSMSELSVYHIDDETDEGEEVEVVNKDGDEIEILATTFSTYALVLSTSSSIILHLDAVGGDLSNNTGVTITDTPNVGDGEITADQNGYVTLPTNVTKTGYTFAGWYEDAQYTSPVLLDGSGKYQVDGNTPTLYAKRINGGGAYGVTYVFADDVTFDGTNYINTDLKLFSSSFGKKDFDINFNVDNITAFNPSQNSNRNNVMHIINEKGNPYQGFDLRLESNANSYKGQIRAVSQKDNFTLGNSTSTSSSFRFWTENNVLHYYDNGVDVTSQDFSSTVSFDWPLAFGAALDGNKEPYRYFKGSLSDITVYVAYDNGDKITLPNPIRPDKIFVGWYTDNQFTHPVTLVNGKYVVGANEILYAKWADYEITIEPNISEFGNVDRTVAFVSDGATIVSSGNALTIIDIVGQEIIITATESGISSFTDRDISDCGSPITKTCTIVANFISDKYIVKFDPNGGTFDMFGNDYELEDGGLYVQVVTSGAKLDELNGEPILPGYVFTGWYDGTNKWDFDEDVVEDNIILKAKWNYLFDYGDLDVYTIGSNGSTDHYTLMDRNMGAEDIYNGDYYDQNFSSFGYVYQWGNNYGFDRIEGNGNTYSPVPSTSNDRVSSTIWEKHTPSNYISSTWITVNPWNGNATIRDDNLWGKDTDVDKKGPCPEGYHIPSQNEFSKGLYIKWSNAYGTVNNTFGSEEQQYFTKDVLIPLAGVHNAGALSESRQGICAEYWQSSTLSNSDINRADNVWFCRDGKEDNTYGGKFSVTSASNRYNGLAVRCFKNGNTASYNLTLNRDGGTNALVSVRTENGVSTINSIKEPVKSGREFGGWYTTNDFQPNSRKNENSTLPAGGTTLYAKWICPIGTVLVGNACEQGVTVSFYDEGGTPGVDNPLEQVTVVSGNAVVYPNVTPTKEGYVFDDWVDENGDSADLTNVTEDMDVFATYRNITNTYTVTWNNSDGTALEIDLNVPYGTMPSYDGETPTSGGDAQYSYTFEGWSPATGVVQGDITYTATYTQSINEYTVMIQPSDINSGTVTTGFITVPYGTNISKSGNILEIGNETSTANPNSQTWQYDFGFVDWTDTCGVMVTTGCIVTANFQSILRTYTLDLIIGTGIEAIYYKINGASEFINTGITTSLSGIEAGSTIYAYAEPKPGYATDISSINLWSVTVTGDNVFSPVATVSNVQYVVYHYVKRVGSGTYALTKTETGFGMTDEPLTLSSLAKESELPCAHYDRGSLTGTEAGPGEVVTETTIRGDGSTRIYLYYTRNSHTVTLSGDVGVQILKINGIQREEAVLECGSDVPVEAVPKPGYHFLRWEEREEKEEKRGEGDDTGL